MITIFFAIVGILSYAGYMDDFSMGQVWAAFADANNVVAWGCALAASIRYFFSDDCDEFFPKVGVFLLDAVVALDLVVTSVVWVKDLLMGAHTFSEILFVLVPLVLAIAALRFKGGNRFMETERMFTVWISAEAALTALCFILFSLNPATSPFVSRKDFTTSIICAVTGASMDQIPVMSNILSWSLRMKLLFAVCVILILDSFICDTKKNPRRLWSNVIKNTTAYVATVYLMLLLFKIRGVVYRQFWYFFVELILVVGFGLLAYFLPLLFVIPVTTTALVSLSDSEDTAAETSGTGMEPDGRPVEYKKKQMVSLLPEVMFHEDSHVLQRTANHGTSAEYCDEQGKRYVVYSASVFENWAETNIGYVHWY